MEKVEERFLFGSFFEEDILRCGKTQLHKLGNYLYVHEINFISFVLEVWCLDDNQVEHAEFHYTYLLRINGTRKETVRPFAILMLYVLKI